MNLLELAWQGPEGLLEGDGINHVFSLIMLPFIGAMLGYLKFNWYPAQVFWGCSSLLWWNDTCRSWHP